MQSSTTRDSIREAIQLPHQPRGEASSTGDSLIREIIIGSKKTFAKPVKQRQGMTKDWLQRRLMHWLGAQVHQGSVYSGDRRKWRLYCLGTGSIMPGHYSMPASKYGLDRASLPDSRTKDVFYFMVWRLQFAIQIPGQRMYSISWSGDYSLAPQLTLFIGSVWGSGVSWRPAEHADESMPLQAAPDTGGGHSSQASCGATPQDSSILYCFCQLQVPVQQWQQGLLLLRSSITAAARLLLQHLECQGQGQRCRKYKVGIDLLLHTEH